MNRDYLREIGLTDEQIDKVMSEHGKSITAEKQKAEGFKNDSIKVNELLKQIEALKQEKSSVDKDNESKDSEIANIREQMESLQKQIKEKELKANLAEKGITGDYADKLIKGLSEGNLDVEILGEILTTKSQSAVDAKVKELEGKAINPNGGTADNGGQEKSDAEKMAENIGKSFAESNKASNNVLAQYIN